MTEELCNILHGSLIQCSAFIIPLQHK